jgi:hypothetical protein
LGTTIETRFKNILEWKIKWEKLWSPKHGLKQNS